MYSIVCGFPETATVSIVVVVLAATVADVLPMEYELPMTVAVIVPVISAAGIFVQLPRFPDCGVPRTGVTNVGPDARTIDPEPVVPLLKLDAAICEPLICTAPTSIVPSVPENTSDVFVASGMNTSFPDESS